MKKMNYAEPSLLSSLIISETFIALPLTDFGTPFSNVIVTYSGSSGASSGVHPRTNKCLAIHHRDNDF